VHTQTITQAHKPKHTWNPNLTSGLIFLAVIVLAMSARNVRYVLKTAFSIGMMDGSTVFITSLYTLRESFIFV